MKTKYWMSSSAVAMAVVILFGSSCTTDWGKVDPPAGIQTAPKLENVAALDFETEALDPFLYKAYSNQDKPLPAIVEDEPKGKVLELNGGWIETPNPLTTVTCEKAASLTFWMKQIPAVVIDEEGNESAEPQDLQGPLFAFFNENHNESLSFSANGWINYKGADGSFSENDPAEAATGYMVPGQWNYVALIVRDNGYDLMVNGEKKASKNVDNFDCRKLVDFMNNAPVFSIGASDNNSLWRIDDLKVYRNELTAKETARPTLPGEGGGQGGFNYATFEYRVGDPVYTIGSPDCTGGWWTDFSNYFRIPAETSMRFSFINHTSGGGNWNNWNLCVSTDAERGGDGYAEYFVVRSDLYGWGEAYNGDNWSNEGYGNWDQFRIDMEGAHVVVDLRREGAEIYMTATATATNGTVYKEMFHATCGEGDQVVRAFFISDGSYLEMQSAGSQAYWAAPVSNVMVGPSDNSAAWWTEFSDYFKVPAGLNLQLGFLNYTSGGGNWNNWNLCVSTDAERGGDGYEEYFVVRSDLYGWGSAYNGDNWTNEGYGNWDQFRLDMDGAHVDLTLVRENEKVTYTSVATALNGTVYKESIWANCGEGDQVLSAFLICDGSHFELIPEECCTFVPLF